MPSEEVIKYGVRLLDGATVSIKRWRPAIVIEQGGSKYEKASPAVRAKIDATKQKLTDLGYTIERLLGGHDYLALPTAEAGRGP